MNNKLAVVLTPHTLEELDINVEALIPILSEIDHQVIVVHSFIDNYVHDENLNVSYVRTPDEIPKVQRYKTGALMVHEDTKVLLFVDDCTKLSKEDVLNHAKLFIEPLIGLIGYKGEAFDEFDTKKLLHEAVTKLQLTEQLFQERCCDDEGKLKYIVPGYLMTSTKLWDLIGGFSNYAITPCIEYGVRIQALGYTLITYKTQE